MNIFTRGISIMLIAALSLMGCGGGGGGGAPAAGGGTGGNTVVTLPAVPVGVAASAVSVSQINLSWTAVTGATGYNVYRSVTAGVTIAAANKITATPVATTTFSNTGLAAATPYFYKVTAVNGAGETVGSAEVTATTQAAAVTPPASGVPAGFVVQASPAALNGVDAVVWTGTQFVALEPPTNIYAAGARYFSWTSADGITWVRNTTNLLPDFTNLSAANGLAFKMTGGAVMSPVTINNSGNGITWATATATYKLGLSVPSPIGVKFLNGKYFASMDAGTCTAISSLDAITWTSVDLKAPLLPTNYSRDPAQNFCSEPFFLGGKYLIYGGVIKDYVSNPANPPAQGLVYSSTDGITWTASGFALPAGVTTIPQGGRTLDVAQIGSAIALPVGISTTTSTMIGSSIDGLNFTYSTVTIPAANTLKLRPEVSLPAGTLATTYVNTGTVAAPNYVLSYYTTTDGITYTPTVNLWFATVLGGEPHAYSPTLRRLVVIKNNLNTLGLFTGSTVATYTFP